MIGYVTLGSNDLDRAVGFYDALLGELGAKQVMNDGRMVIYGSGAGQPMVAVCKPYDGEAATAGNGTMVALAMEGPEAVDKLHARALELGGSDEGAAGPRSGGFYGGYFRDLDGQQARGLLLRVVLAGGPHGARSALRRQSEAERRGLVDGGGARSTSRVAGLRLALGVRSHVDAFAVRERRVRDGNRRGRGGQQPLLECWSLLAGIAMATERVELGTTARTSCSAIPP